MESVEELCEHIALIDKSNKILDGNLQDIKRAYKTNTFEIGIHVNNPEALQKELVTKFDVTTAGFKSLEDDLKLNIKIPKEDTANDLIRFLTSKGELNHFVEVIPSASEIFIKAVNNNQKSI
jgi:ABC-2 type transport system ATP-binding protein